MLKKHHLNLEKLAPTSTKIISEDRGQLSKFLIGFVTSVKNIQLNYTESGGTMLPGYLPGLGFFGTSKPSLGFVFGDQSDIRYEAQNMDTLLIIQNLTRTLLKLKLNDLIILLKLSQFPI